MAVVITAHQRKKLNELQLASVLDELASMSDAEAQQLVDAQNQDNIKD